MNNPGMQKAAHFLYGALSLAAALTIIFPVGRAEAEIYKWVDEGGVLHFQDTPPDGVGSGEVEVIEVEERSAPAVDESAAAEPVAAQVRQEPLPPDPEPRAVRKKGPGVVLYTTSWCTYCAKARAYLRSRGIPFVDYDVEKDKEAARRRKRLYRKQGVPLAVINGRKILGFSAQAYDRALTLPPPR